MKRTILSFVAVVLIVSWFNSNAEEAVNYYVSVFPDSKIDTIARWPMDRTQPTPAKKGDVLAIDFTLGGQPYKNPTHQRNILPFHTFIL